MRKANVHDMFNVARLISDLGIKQEIFNAQKGKEDIEQIGFDMIFDILEKATTAKAEEKLFKVLSEPFEMDAKEVAKLELDEFIKNINECFNMQTLANFISRVGPMVS